MRFLERLNSPAVLVVAVAVFLVLDGFLFYRYQQSLRSTAGSASDTPVEEASYSPKAEPTKSVQETTSSPRTEPTATEETTSSLEEKPTATEETTSSSEEEEEEEEEEEDGVRVVVEVADTGVGLTILEDGLLVYDQVASSGFSEEFQAEEAVTVTAADAGPVQVGVNDDDPEPLGASGEPVTRTFTAET